MVIEVTLVYKDGKQWFAGQFKSMKDVKTWVEAEKKKFYWDESTDVQIVDRTDEYAQQEAAAKASIDAAIARRQAARSALADIRKNKPKTVAELVGALDKVLELLDVEAAP